MMKHSPAIFEENGPRDPARRRALGLLGAAVLAGTALAAGLASGPGAFAAAGGPEVVIYKSPWCGCCANWARHLERLGFRTVIRNLEDLTPIKTRYGVPARLQSCHTALVDGYVIEGHVPGDLVKRLLAERPQVAGLAVPGMPSSSPGMDQPTGERYEVLIFDKQGRSGLYARR